MLTKRPSVCIIYMYFNCIIILRFYYTFAFAHRVCRLGIFFKNLYVINNRQKYAIVIINPKKGSERHGTGRTSSGNARRAR